MPKLNHFNDQGQAHMVDVSSKKITSRIAVAKALLNFSKDDSLKKTYLEYGRKLLVPDVRRREPCKPNNSKARHKRQKSYR